MTLANIDDFNLRLKVAKLMAISPALPVKDIYDLVIEMKGHYHQAKDHLSRISQTPGPSTRPQTLIEPICLSEDEEVLVEVDFDNPDEARERVHRIVQTPSLTTRPQILPEPIDQSEEEELIVKVDFDDPDIYLDNDVPSTPSPHVAVKATARKKKQAGAHPKRSTAQIAKARAKKTAKLSMMAAVTPKHTAKLSKAMKATVKSKTKSSTAGVKKPSNTSWSRRRSSSITRDFIVVDDDSEEDASYRQQGPIRYSDDEEMWDLDVEEDLATIMRP
jgi:hypothetical protein